MRRRAHLAIGAVCGVMCVAGILSYAADLRADIEQERSEALARYGGEQVEIVVATDDIAVGDMLDSTNSEKRLWLSELVPDGAVSDLADVSALPATSPIYAGEVVVEQRFDEHESVALQVPDGKCAVSVPAKSVSAVGGSLAPGSRVDVYSASGTSTDLLASRVLVLSTSSTSQEESERKSDVTWVVLAVDPEMVEELIAASQKSELYFSLPSEDAQNAASSGKDANTSVSRSRAQGADDKGDEEAKDSRVTGAGATAAGASGEDALSEDEKAAQEREGLAGVEGNEAKEA